MRVLFFDGYCTLCNGFIDWMMRHDRNAHIKYASLQGVSAQSLLSPELTSQNHLETIVYLRDGEVYDRSTAVFKSIADLGGVWRLAALGLVIPRFVRDPLYSLMAKSRYILFGRRQACRIPTPEEKDRILP